MKKKLRKRLGMGLLGVAVGTMVALSIAIGSIHVIAVTIAVGVWAGGVLVVKAIKEANEEDVIDSE